MSVLYLVGKEVRRPVWLVMMVGVFLGPCSLLLSAQLSWFALLAGVLSMGFVAWFVLAPTPWFEDTAFWRTRPISRRQMFAVKSVVMFLLVVVPVVLAVTLIVSSMTGESRWLFVLMGLVGAVTVLVLVATVAVMGTVGRSFAALGWLSLTFVPMVSFGVLSVLWHQLGWPTLRGSAESSFYWLFAMMVLWMGTGLVSWWLAGRLGSYRKAGVVLLVSGLVWPAVFVVGSRTVSLSTGNEMRQLSFVKGESVLRVPLAIEGLKENELFFPNLISKGGKVETLIGGSRHLFPPGDDEPFRVFEERHSRFGYVVDVEKVWGRLRKRLPYHESWIPSEPGSQFAHHFLHSSEGASVPDDLGMAGSIYEVKSLDSFPLSKVGGRRLAGGLRFLRAKVPNEHAIDVELRLDSEVLNKLEREVWLRWCAPPQVWGVLFHPSSGTAYGTVSGRVDGSAPGTCDLLIERRNLLLRFELPRLETALLGLDPETVLAESQLYLFSFEEGETAKVNFEKNSSF